MVAVTTLVACGPMTSTMDGGAAGGQRPGGERFADGGFEPGWAESAAPGHAELVLDGQ